ncbi:UNVERIFIED_CONTAM: hypothetical protein RMT77_008571 [Armadillidium vulgare]
MDQSSNLTNDDIHIFDYFECGLSTKTALERLHNEVSNELDNFENCHKTKGIIKLRRLLKDSFHHSSFLSLFRWTSFLVIIATFCFFLIVCDAHDSQRFVWVPTQSFLLLIGTFIIIFLICWDSYLRHQELPNLVREVLDELKACSSSVIWESRNYPHLHSPLSPCITLQWTKRDNDIVNLPCSLLVKGDIILLRPGQKAPGRCQSIEDKLKGETGMVLQLGDIYSPFVEGVGEGFTSPKARVPLQETPFVLLETPYLTNLRILLDEALNRPTTLFNKLGHYLYARGLEFFGIPTFWVLTVSLNLFRLYYDGWAGDWSETLLMVPFCVILPLVPYSMPLMWLILHWIGTASILSIYNHAKNLQKNPAGDPFEGAELKVLELPEDISLLEETKREFFNVMLGRQSAPVRTANLIHVLSSITNLCCVDKKGILSWPNPTAEKLFFLRNKAHNISRSNVFSSATSLSKEEVVRESQVLEHNSSKESECVLMSLTHDHLTAFGLQFDDRAWKRYLFSLKPLGLNILLNTCNPETQSHYTRFCSHITCEAMYNEDLVPVSQRSVHESKLHTEIQVFSRGCLCELPKQMGFRTKAQEPFKLEHQLCTFRHVPLDMACKDRLARSLSITKLKFPFPHMVSVLLRDKCSGKLELMSQGTADIILDSCTDFWDGYDINPLTDKDRKKIIDFYHRTSLSAYCTAFAYRPTSCTIKEDLTSFYMELPIDPTHLYHAARTPTPHISTEALFGDNEHTEVEEIVDIEDSFRMQCKQIFIGMVTMQYQAKSDVVRMIEELDSSCIRFVHFSKENELRSRVFSEKMGLESGWNCHISLLSDRTRTESGNSSRIGNTSAKASGLTLFHLSNEDLNSPELGRSRVRGSGNFYRSKSLRRKCPKFRSALEVSRALSHSAPSAINLDVAQVKFEDASMSSRSSFSEELSQNEEEKRLVDSEWDCNEDGGENCMNFNDDGFEEEDLCQGIHAQFPLSGSVSTDQLNPSSSSSTSSSEQPASLNLFDMSNRARLPKGIENIRPHLENVDNVPLLVSLFTDCTTPTTKAMVAIMQDYTEVVVVLGSTANAENMLLFMKADLCIGVDPNHPQVCMREPVFVRPPPDKGPPPMELARKLNSIPCSLCFKREDRISLTQLILKSRHFMQHFMSCFQFLACCNVSISFIQFISVAGFLPPVLSSGDVLWLITVPVPILSISLVFAPINPAIMNQATGKNEVLVNKETLKYILLYYVSKFGPSLLLISVSTIWIFSSFCEHSAGESCEYIYPANSSSKESWGGWGKENSYSLNVVQKIVGLQLVLYFVIISVGFVHRMYQLWNRNPFTNIAWVLSSVLVIVIQLVYCTVSILLSADSSNEYHSSPGISDIPVGPLVLTFLFPLLLLPINELIKRREIRVNVRYQKRARLEFGTKLGMNSPF